MTENRSYQSNFSGGRISPRLNSRVDLDLYNNAVQTADNCILLQGGGARRRGGLALKAELTAPSAASEYTRWQAEEFIFDEEEGYMIAFRADGDADVVLRDGTVQTTITGGNWAEAQIGKLSVTQSLNTMIVCNRDKAIQRILRTGLDSFTIGGFDFEVNSVSGRKNCPYYKFAASNITVTPAATTGTGVQLLASGAAFAASMVGEQLLIKNKAVEVASYVSDSEVTIDIKEDLEDTEATIDWEEEAFNDRNGWPGCCIFFQQRLWFAGHTVLRDGIWASKTGAFFNFDTGTGLDDESIQYFISGDAIGEIRYMTAKDDLVLHTQRREYYVPADNDALTPSTFSPKPQGKFGCPFVKPVVYDDAVYFLSLNKKTLREFVYQDVTEDYSAAAVSILSEDYVPNTVRMKSIEEMPNGPESMLLLIQSTGDCTTFTSTRSEEQAGWARWTTDGTFIDVSTLGDEIFFIIKRTINDVDRYFVEQYDESYWLDHGQLVNQDSEGNWTIDTDYIGQSLYIVDRIHGRSIGQFEMDQINNDAAVPTGNLAPATVEVGFDFRMRLDPMPPELALRDGPSPGEPRRIVKTNIRLYQSYEVTVNEESVDANFLVNEVDQLVPTITGVYENWHLGWDETGQIIVSQPSPLPMEVSAINIEVEW